MGDQTRAWPREPVSGKLRPHTRKWFGLRSYGVLRASCTNNIFRVRQRQGHDFNFSMELPLSYTLGLVVVMARFAFVAIQITVRDHVGWANLPCGKPPEIKGILKRRVPP